MKFLSKFLAIVFAAGIFLAVTPVVRAQIVSATTITPVPDGANFTVDGTNYTHTVTVMWPQGSAHYLYAQPEQDSTIYHTKYSFINWTWAGGSIAQNPAVVTADPTIKTYQAQFSVQYGLNLMFNPCTVGPCASPGFVSVNGTNFTTSQETYVAAGSTAILQAFPNPGYVFAGWVSASGQTIQGFQTSVPMNAPVSITALFEPVETVNLTTLPAGLNVFADRTSVPTPSSIGWGLNTVHTLGVISPQLDLQGNWWVFNSWSDGGAMTHAYTVTQIMPTTVTATFAPGVAVELMTNPQGLNLTVDNRSNWTSYTFLWGVGETHAVQAPASQTDNKGRIWNFSSWSNSGTQTQNVTVPQSAVGTGMRLVANYTQVGHLTVTSGLAGLSVMVNGSACALPCDVLQPLGTQITVSAPASVPLAQGSRQDFAGWSNGAAGDLVVSLGQDPLTVAAIYRQMNYLAVATAPNGAASWNLQPASADGFYDAQTSVAVNVNPLPGFRFRSWNGDLSGSSPSGMVAMNAPRAVQAMFDKVPYIAPTGVSNGAGSTPQSGVAPGSVVSIFGANLANSVAVGPSNPMAQTLGDTTVRLGDRLLPLFFVSSTQVNFQLPADLQPGTQSVVVSTQGQPDAQASFQVVQNAPGLFPLALNGQTFAVASHADGTPVTPAAPAQAGETVTVFGTGFGPTSPARPFGFAIPASPVYAVTDGVTVQIGAASVTATAFAAAGTVGVDGVQFVVDGPSGSNAAITVTVNGQVSNSVLLPIQ
jgi:uncharacterized protein (TIGR03437 family)